jgi:hypothetical protein
MAAVTSISGNNADLLREVGSLYIRDGELVVDPTYGKGAWWRKTNLSRFTLLPTDLFPLPPATQADFRKLPYADGCADVAVLDPPYVHNPGKHVTDQRYNNAATTKGMYHRDILILYMQGMMELKRILNPDGGRLFVKCKDEVEANVQCWSHIEIYQAALLMDFYARDLFLLTPTSKTSERRWKKQHHARKTHSYLWVFERRLKAPKPRTGRIETIFPGVGFVAAPELPPLYFSPPEA